MPVSRKRSILYLSVIVGLLAFAYCLRFVFHPMTSNALLGISMMTLRWVIHITLTVFWCISLRRRILIRPIRNMLLSVGALLLGWQIVRIIKYDYVIVTAPIGRYCWYAYYIAMVLVPLIGVFVVNHIGKPEDYRCPAWMKYLYIPAFLLILVVFTNDLHQLVFTFPNGFELYNSDYGYGFMYIVIMAWFVVLALLFAIRLLFKSRVPGSKNFQRLPLFITLFAILFWTGYTLKLYTGDLTAVDCLFIVMLLEGAIQSGLIPSNMNYNELFRQTTIAAQIIDSTHTVQYSSAVADALDRALIEQALTQPVDLGDTILHSQPISGGHILWQDDVKVINDLAAHLREANETLQEQYALKKAEVELRERTLQAEEKNRLYDRIAKEIAPQLNHADNLLRLIEEHPDQTDALLSQLCVISAYIKRRANLVLLGEDSAVIPARELEACLRESLSNLELCSVKTFLDCRCDGPADWTDIVAMYDLFESVIESLLGKLCAVVVTIACEDSGIRLRIQAGCLEEVPALPKFTLPGGTIRCEVQEEDLILHATLQQGGESK